MRGADVCVCVSVHGAVELGDVDGTHAAARDAHLRCQPQRPTE